MKNYERKFVIKEYNKEKLIVHTWNHPYPEMYFKNNDNENKNAINTNDNKINNDNQRIKLIKENLTCFMVKLYFYRRSRYFTWVSNNLKKRIRKKQK